MIESEIIKKNKVEEYLKDHFLSKDVGNDKKACSIASINIALGNGPIEDVPETVSPVIANWLMLTQDIVSDKYRNNQLKKLIPELIGTEGDAAKELKRVKMLKYWVFNGLARKIENGFLDVLYGGTIDQWPKLQMLYKEMLRLKSKKSFAELSKEIPVSSYDKYLDMLYFITKEEDINKVAKKVGLIGMYNNDQEWFDKEVIKLIKKMIK